MLVCPSTVECAVGIQFSYIRTVEETLQLLAASIELLIHCSDHVQSVYESPRSDLGKIETIAETLAQEEGEIKFTPHCARPKQALDH